MRRALVILIVTLLLMAWPSAAAHADAEVAAGVVELEPGERVARTFEVHYHRIFGAAEAEGGAVALAVYDDAAYHALLAGEAATPRWSSGPLAGRLAFNVLLECCEESSWSQFHLVAENTGAAPARLAWEARAAHEDWLVGMAGIEGDIFQNTGAFVLLAGVFGWRTWRADRTRGAHGRPASDVQRALRTSVALFLAPAVFALAAATWANATYGGGFAAGLTVALASIFPSFGTVVFMAVTVLSWGFASAYWLRAFRRVRQGGLPSTPVVLVGLGGGLLLLAAPLPVVLAYGARVLLLAALMVVPAALVLLAGSARLAVAARAA